jgi:hypothetical protein
MRDVRDDGFDDDEPDDDVADDSGADESGDAGTDGDDDDAGDDNDDLRLREGGGAIMEPELLANQGYNTTYMYVRVRQ